jgi:hypothetical protein
LFQDQKRVFREEMRISPSADLCASSVTLSDCFLENEGPPGIMLRDALMVNHYDLADAAPTS